MKRVLAIAIMLLVISSTCLFARVWFAPYSASFGANLGDTDLYRGLAGMTVDKVPDYIPQQGDGYSYETMVSILGITETSSETTVSISFPNGGDWEYKSISQPDATRKFEIYVVERRRYEDWNKWELLGATTGVRGNSTIPDDTIRIVHLGEGANPTVEFTFPPTNKTIGTDGEPAEMGNVNGEPCEDVLIGCWVDIILCLPKQENITPANDYYASLDVNVSGGASGTFHCEFTGYYDIVPDYVQNSGDVLFNVVPNANASSINLSTANDLIAPDGPGLEIGRYSYSTTNPYDSETYENSYYLFASSSPSAVSNTDGQFKLRLQGTDESISNDSIEIPFSIGLVTDGHELSGGGYEDGYYKWFDGTTDATSLKESMKPSLGGRAEQIEGSKPIYIYYDNGSVLFRLDYDRLASTLDGQQINPIDKLIAGNYTSKIYFHVISEL